MGFLEKVKLEAKRKAHYRCVICRSYGFLNVHHLKPKKDGGSDDLENAVPLCASCHAEYGDNPSLRKWIKEQRDFWYDHCKKILNYENLEQLERTYQIIEELQSESKEKIQKLEQKIEILDSSFQQQVNIIKDLISKLPHSNIQERQEISTEIQNYSIILGILGSILGGLISNISQNKKLYKKKVEQTAFQKIYNRLISKDTSNITIDINTSISFVGLREFARILRMNIIPNERGFKMMNNHWFLFIHLRFHNIIIIRSMKDKLTYSFQNPENNIEILFEFLEYYKKCCENEGIEINP